MNLRRALLALAAILAGAMPAIPASAAPGDPPTAAATPGAATASPAPAYPGSYGAASELERQVRRQSDVLNDAPVRGAYGADDTWDAVDAAAGTPPAGGAKGKKGDKAKPSTGSRPLQPG